MLASVRRLTQPGSVSCFADAWARGRAHDANATGGGGSLPAGAAFLPALREWLRERATSAQRAQAGLVGGALRFVRIDFETTLRAYPMSSHAVIEYARLVRAIVGDELRGVAELGASPLVLRV